MTTSADDEGKKTAGAMNCASCGAALEDGQRYCVECGARHGPLPAKVSDRIDAISRRARDDVGRAGEDATGVAGGDLTEDGSDPSRGSSIPGPRGIAVAIMCLFGFGLLVGSGTSQSAQDAGITRILLEGPAETASTPQEPTASAPAPEPAPVSALPAYTPEALPAEPAPPPPVEPAPEPTPPPEVPEAFELPQVKHVFLIVLADHGFEEAFGTASPAPYLAKTLTSQGELLPNYYAVAQSDLANEIALLSGHGPNPETVANCPTYTDIAPGTIGTEEQVEGNGCVYPAGTLTLPGQLSAAGKPWKAYVEDIGNGEAGQPTTCRHPAIGAPDANQLPLPNDAYETWRNPFVYFHSLTDGSECAEHDVGLDQFQTDLQAKGTTPALSYVVPNACHDGSEQPCAPEQPAGLAAAEPFLRTVVPEIKASPAYKDGGLIAITFAEAPQTGPNADASSCCATPEYPNLPSAESTAPATGPVKPTGGGGRVGLLLISPFVKAKSVEEAGYYNHFSLLLSIENLFGLKPAGYASNLALSAFESTVFNAG